ncbi:replicative DNA helicase [Pseudomonas oryzihabitans]|uniref:replicative DNA helicase n=1 Tax=Pseudomonas oryzihabitans TaxID=47885 RepID=UPI00119DF25E|nr:replicative DNA helicase [Pseudomonas psychrotolerans]
MTRELFSLEAEHNVLGAMLQRPELIDVLMADLKASDFYDRDCAEVFRAIQVMQSQGQPVDAFTVADKIGMLSDGTLALGFTGQLHHNVTAASNAKEYARIVRERAMDRALLGLSQRIVDLAHQNAPTEDKVAAIQAEVLGLDSDTTSEVIVDAWDVLSEHMATLERREELQGGFEGLSTGIPDLDELLQGLRPEQLIVIAGRPAMGKTTLAMNIAADVAIRQRKVALVVSLEMSNGQLMDRFLAAEGKVPLQDIKAGRGFIGENGMRMNAAGAKIKDSGLKMTDRPCLTMGRIRAEARKKKRQSGLDLVVIDYLQLVDDDGNTDNRVQQVSAISRGCKLMARELGCPVIILSQLSRDVEKRPNKRPVPSDLRESGAIEQDADMIMFVYRDEVYHPDTEALGIAEIIIGKGRDIETGTVRTAFLGRFSKFEPLAVSSMEEVEASRPFQGRNYGRGAA